MHTDREMCSPYVAQSFLIRTTLTDFWMTSCLFSFWKNAKFPCQTCSPENKHLVLHQILSGLLCFFQIQSGQLETLHHLLSSFYFLYANVRRGLLHHLLETYSLFGEDDHTVCNEYGDTVWYFESFFWWSTLNGSLWWSMAKPKNTKIWILLHFVFPIDDKYKSTLSCECLNIHNSQISAKCILFLSEKSFSLCTQTTPMLV